MSNKIRYTVQEPEEMMDKKLTVWIPHHVLKNAKKYSESQNISLSHLISIFLQSLPDERNFLENAPIVRRLSGLLASDVSNKDYRKYLEKKYDL